MLILAIALTLGGVGQGLADPDSGSESSGDEAMKAGGQGFLTWTKTLSILMLIPGAKSRGPGFWRLIPMALVSASGHSVSNVQGPVAVIIKVNGQDHQDSERCMIRAAIADSSCIILHNTIGLSFLERRRAALTGRRLLFVPSQTRRFPRKIPTRRVVLRLPRAAGLVAPAGRQ